MKYLKKSLMAVFAAVALFLPAAAQANTGFDQWLHGFKQYARARGIAEATLQTAFAGVEPIPKVIELDRKQPEHKITFDEYQQKTLTPARVEEGRRLLRENWTVLHQVEQRYGVQAQYIVSLWGMETGYGKNTGGFDIIGSLATLAWEGRRGDYFRDELLKSLKILQDGHVARGDFKGSWAGAMGQVQFMPSSWQRYAVDYNGDGHKDIWTTRADAFASAANYLSQSGWKYGQRWGREVRLPPRFSDSLVGKETRKTLAEWSRLGVRAAGGGNLPADEDVSAFVISPTGAHGKAYLGYANAATIMKWNNSSYFAITVGQLADKISGASSPSAVYAKNPAPAHGYNE